MNYNIRPHQTSDFPRLIELFQEFAEFEKNSQFMTNSVAKMQAEKDFFNAIVVENDAGIIIGYVAYFICYHTWTGKTMFMDDLYIQPDYRGSGLGSLLVNKMIDLSKAKKCNKLKWQVSRWNKPAIEFYQKLGAQINDVEMDCHLYLE